MAKTNKPYTQCVFLDAPPLHEQPRLGALVVVGAVLVIFNFFSKTT